MTFTVTQRTCGQGSHSYRFVASYDVTEDCFAIISQMSVPERPATWIDNDNT
jgi:hypothetical protein